MSVVVVADPGSTWCGKKEYAKELIRKCKDCGASYVKFQLFDEKQKGPNTVMPLDLMGELIAYGREVQIPVTASVFNERALEFLYRQDVPFIKFAYSMRKSPMIEAALKMGKRVTVSCDDMSVDDLPRGEKLATLYCRGVYPDREKRDFEGMFDRFTGYSSHHLGIKQDLEAAKHRALIIEKHVSLEYTDSRLTPDGRFALGFKQLHELCWALNGEELKRRGFDSTYRQ